MGLVPVNGKQGRMESYPACVPLHVKIGGASFESGGDGVPRMQTFCIFLPNPLPEKGGYKRRKSGRERQCRVSEDRVRLGVSP